jgi:hypothetical protein
VNISEHSATGCYDTIILTIKNIKWSGQQKKLAKKRNVLLNEIQGQS